MPMPNARKKRCKNALKKPKKRLEPKKDETVAQVQARVEKTLERYAVKDCFQVEVKETINRQNNYKKRGRPGPNTPMAKNSQFAFRISAQTDGY